LINYYRFCCRIRIADEYAEEVPGGEFLAVEEGRAVDRREQFADARLNDVSDWFTETPALLAHIRALQSGRTPDVRARLIETDAATLYTGQSRQALYALSRRGRLTRHYTRRGRRERTMWDPLELELVKRITKD
jgi:hypothetical protein